MKKENLTPPGIKEFYSFSFKHEFMMILVDLLIFKDSGGPKVSRIRISKTKGIRKKKVPFWVARQLSPLAPLPLA